MIVPTIVLSLAALSAAESEQKADNFYAIGHMANTIDAIEYFRKNGYNGIEIDVQYEESTGYPINVHHGAPCDCSCQIPPPGSGVCKFFGSLCPHLTVIDTITAHIIESWIDLPLLWIDAKNEGRNLKNAGKFMVEYLIQHLFKKGFRGQVLIDSTEEDYLRSASNVFSKQEEIYKDRIYFSYYNNDKSDEAKLEFMQGLATPRNIIFHAGESRCGGRNSKSQIQKLQQWHEAKKISKVFTWTIDTIGNFKAYTDSGARGIITNEDNLPAWVNANTPYKLATVDDHGIRPVPARQFSEDERLKAQQLEDERLKACEDDVDNGSCEIWGNPPGDCEKAVEKYGYSQSQQDVILAKCPATCERCDCTPHESCTGEVWRYRASKDAEWQEQSPCADPDHTGFKWCPLEGYENYTNNDQKWRKCHCGLLATKGGAPRTHSGHTSCQNGAGSDYDGHANETNGVTCQEWEETNYDRLPNNYCRNPDGYTGVWCYTNYSKSEWGYCKVPLCPATCSEQAVKDVISSAPNMIEPSTPNCTTPGGGVDHQCAVECAPGFTARDDLAVTCGGNNAPTITGTCTVLATKGTNCTGQSFNDKIAVSGAKLDRMSCSGAQASGTVCDVTCEVSSHTLATTGKLTCTNGVVAETVAPECTPKVTVDTPREQLR